MGRSEVVASPEVRRDGARRFRGASHERLQQIMEIGGGTVEVTLIPVGEGTSLRLRHIGLSAEERTSHSDGWDHFLP